jgi:tetratricopeptide (TPR) repeat protein/transglutaminase-like putative cysteine protease
MKRLWTVLLCALILSAATSAQQPASAPLPTQNAPPPKQKQNPSDYSQEPFVVEQYYTSARFETDATGQRAVTARIHVQSEAGVQQLGELVFGYNSANEQMDVNYVRVRKVDGTVVNAGPDAVKEMTAMVARDAPVYTDYKEKHITVPSLRPGDTIEYEIVTRLVTALAPDQFWFEQNFLDGAIVLDERLEIRVPRGRAVNLQSPLFPYEKDEADGWTSYRWKHTNLTRTGEEESKKKKPQRAEAKAPAVQLTTFASWKEVAEWYAKLERGRTQPTPEIRAKTQELIQGRTDELDKMDALYEYVSKNIRYVSLSFGLGRYQPHSAAEVFANQYGDCKDKNTLLTAMLDAAGIQADAVLIPFSRKLDLSVPSPSQFDHLITAVPKGNELIWMDSTAEVAPFRLLSRTLRDKSALLVPPDGAGKIVETPADPPFPSVQRVEIEARVSDLGKLEAKFHYVLRGDNEFALRAAFRRTPETQWKQLAQTIASLDGLKGEVTSVKPSDPSETKDPFVLDLEFSQANFLDWSSRKAKVPLPLPSIGLPDVSEDNAEPIELGSPLDVITTLKLTLPETFTAQAPVAVGVKRDYAEFRSSYRFENHTLDVERSVDFKMRSLPAARTGDYMAFARAVESDESQVLVAENSTPGTPAIPSTVKPDELLEAGIAAMNSGNPTAALPLFQRVVELDPKHKLAWNYLGLGYLRIGKFNEAADAFRHQIDVNPYDEHAYDYLGIALQQQQMYNSAAEAYRKQIEVNPLDSLAHAALGQLFVEQHKYADAIPELDKATILSPDDAGLRISLGQAYLNTGEREKGLAAFEKAAQLSQTPAVWNNIAYNLADHKIELDKAQQYAESAISRTAANLRNVELAHITLDDLGEVSSIGAYWDTLGWVYFQKGDLSTADRFVRASWLLNQHGEVADHLGQIYEKLGEKDRAIHMYALGIAALHSIPETRGRLASLLGSNEKDPRIEDLVNKARPELTAMRTLSLQKLEENKVSADFFVLLAPSPDHPAARIKAVQFISGSDALRSSGEKLRSLDSDGMFPDASPLKIVRRGTLSCAAATGDCSFTLILPEDVRTVN